MSHTDSSENATGVGELREALLDANIPTLLMVLRHLTGDSRWTADPYRPNRGRPLDDNDSAELTAELQAEVRAAALEAVVAFREGRLEPVTPSPPEVAEMLVSLTALPTPAGPPPTEMPL